MGLFHVTAHLLVFFKTCSFNLCHVFMTHWSCVWVVNLRVSVLVMPLTKGRGISEPIYFRWRPLLRCLYKPSADREPFLHSLHLFCARPEEKVSVCAAVQSPAVSTSYKLLWRVRKWPGYKCVYLCWCVWSWRKDVLNAWKKMGIHG